MSRPAKLCITAPQNGTLHVPSGLPDDGLSLNVCASWRLIFSNSDESHPSGAAVAFLRLHVEYLQSHLVVSYGNYSELHTTRSAPPGLLATSLAHSSDKRHITRRTVVIIHVANGEFWGSSTPNQKTGKNFSVRIKQK